MGRVEERARFDADTRLSLIEGDMDREAAARHEFEQRVEARLDSIDQRQGKILWAVVGLLISVTTTCIVILITTGVAK